MNFEKKCVSVIVPSYNRGYILAQTIPTYLQEDVAELILVDDCSTDDTPEVVAALQREHPEIQYYRNEQNLRQTGAKNAALAHVTMPYVYFGDDDSILLPGTIRHLLQTMEEKQADIVGTVPLYADSMEDIAHPEACLERQAPYVEDPYKILALDNLHKLGFFFRTKEPVRFPFTHACALVRTTFAKGVSYDTRYGGNSYREETDYFLSCSEKGAVVYFDSQSGAQVNFPKDVIQRKRTLKSMLRHGYYDIVNTLKLIDKHYAYFRDVMHYPHSKAYMKARYVIVDCWQYLWLTPPRLAGILWRKLHG